MLTGLFDIVKNLSPKYLTALRYLFFKLHSSTYSNRYLAYGKLIKFHHNSEDRTGSSESQFLLPYFSAQFNLRSHNESNFNT